MFIIYKKLIFSLYNIYIKYAILSISLIILHYFNIISDIENNYRIKKIINILIKRGNR